MTTRIMKRILCPFRAPLAAMALTILPSLGALAAVPSATAAPPDAAKLTSWAARLEGPDPAGSVGRHNTEVAAALSEQLASQPTFGGSTSADVGYLSDLKSAGIPTDDPALAKNEIGLGHAIVDYLHKHPTCDAVMTVGATGLNLGFTLHQMAAFVVLAAKWYGPDLLPMLRSCAEAP